MQDNIKRDYIWNTAGVFLQSAISPLLLVAITRINGIYDSGVFSYAFAIALIFWAFGMWGGRTYQVSDVKREFPHRSYIVVRLLLAFVMVVCSIIFVVVNNYDLVKSGTIVMLVLLKAIESIADSLYGVMQIHGRLFLSGRSLMYKSTIGLVVFVITDIITGSVFLSSTGIVAANILLILFYDLPRANKLESVRIKIGQVATHTRQAIDIIKRCTAVSVVMFLAMFSLNIPRYFIDMYHANEIGYFGIIAMPITLIALFVLFILQPNVVELAVLYEKKKYREFRRTVNRITLFILALGVFVLITTAVVGSQILQIIFGVDFSNHQSALIIIVFGGVINALVSLFINILVIMRRTRAQFYVLLVTNIALVIASLLVVPRYSLLGGVSLFAMFNAVQLVLLINIYRNVGGKEAIIQRRVRG